ncbi:MAG: class I SAM-dependent methyltransferase [Armatimonadota bacterium]
MQVPESEGEQRRWLAARAREVLESVPVGRGDCVVDFGCGGGTYAVPAAQLVGPGGTIHALDCDADRIQALESAAREAGVGNVRLIHGRGGVCIPLDDTSCDVGLLYDVLQNIEDWDGLFAEMRRVLRPGGFLSVYPMHLDPHQVRAALAAAGFRFRDHYAGLVLHFVRE